MAIYNERIDFTREQLLENYLKRDSLPNLVYGIIRFLGIIVQNIYSVSSYLVLSWIILFPVSWIRSDLYSKAENYLYNSLLFLVSSWGMAAGIAVVEAGDEYKQLIEDPQAISEAPNTPIKSGDDSVTKHQSLKLQTKIDCNAKLKLPNGDQLPVDKNSDNSTKMVDILERSNDSATTLQDNGDDLSRTNNHIPKSCCPGEKINCNNNDISTSKNNLKQANGETESMRPESLSQIESMSFRDTPRKPRVLILCNHISTADVPLIMQSLSTLTNQSILWVLDAQFKPTNFGLVCISHGDFFIAKDSFTDGSLRDQVLKHPDRNLLVLFPEGGFWRKRLDGSNRYALKNGLPMTRYVTHPRFGAFKDLIDPSVEVTHIVDATLLYDDIKNPLSILNIALGNRKEPAILHYKVYERSKINPNEEWLRKIWMEKDKLLQQYYEDRGQVYRQFEGTMRSAKLDWIKLLSVHLFYLLVCYLTIYRLFSATSVTMLKARDLYYSNI